MMTSRLPKVNFLVFLLVSALLSTQLLGCGRTASRIGGKGFAQIIEIEDMASFISIGFDKRGDSVVKDVTFLSNDGYVYTQEFKDLSPLEGAIRWVPEDEDASLFQSRTLSRWFGSAVDLRLPEDCAKVLGVDVTYSDKNERNKNLTYLATNGKILSREYREGFLDRYLEGWLEIRAKK